MRIAASSAIYAFSPGHSPAATVPPGTQVVFETRDCFSNRLQEESHSFFEVGWENINPATGPLAVVGAEPGDTLAVSVEKIEVGPKGTMIAVPGFGALGDLVTREETRIIAITQGRAKFGKVELVMEPMIGVIGTQPEEETVPCGTPGPHGGNVDTRLIREGAMVYLPVFTPGAGLAMGDLHALMGDGEIVVCGLEVPGEVTVTVDLVKGRQEPGPVVKYQGTWYILASALTLDEASQLAIEHAVSFVMARTGLTLNHAAMLLSLVGQLQVSQVVDPLKTARMAIPGSLLAAYGGDRF
ncbi:MAG: acetamidase/formamidase family protein [Bacillota bacterium]